MSIGYLHIQSELKLILKFDQIQIQMPHTDTDTDADANADTFDRAAMPRWNWEFNARIN